MPGCPQASSLAHDEKGRIGALGISTETVVAEPGYGWAVDPDNQGSLRPRPYGSLGRKATLDPDLQGRRNRHGGREEWKKKTSTTLDGKDYGGWAWR